MGLDGKARKPRPSSAKKVTNEALSEYGENTVVVDRDAASLGPLFDEDSAATAKRKMRAPTQKTRSRRSKKK